MLQKGAIYGDNMERKYLKGLVNWMNDEDVIPIDVKKKKGSLNSLEEFRNHNKRNTAIKISENQFGYNEDNMILTIPYYYFPFYLNEIKK